MVALKQATYVREDYEEGKAYVFYQHMRTPGLNENFYKSIQQDPGIFLTKGEVVSVFQKRRRPGGRSHNTLLGERSRSRPTWWCWAGMDSGHQG
jgi:quinone-modifying oxidoreductase subunit QmoB